MTLASGHHHPSATEQRRPRHERHKRQSSTRQTNQTGKLQAQQDSPSEQPRAMSLPQRRTTRRRNARMPPQPEKPAQRPAKRTLRPNKPSTSTVKTLATQVETPRKVKAPRLRGRTAGSDWHCPPSAEPLHQHHQRSAALKRRSRTPKQTGKQATTTTAPQRAKSNPRLGYHP